MSKTTLDDSDQVINTKNIEQKDSGFLPNFCSGRNVLLVITGAEILAFVLALAQTVTGGDFWARFVLISLFTQWIALGSVALLCYFRSLINRKTTMQSTAIAFGIIMSVTLVFSLFALWLIQYQYLYLQLNPDFASSFIIRNLVICAIVTGLVLRYFYVQHQWITNTEAQAKARIQALQARIRPHFLFNSMNTIASLTRSNPDQAEQAVMDLADLFRVSLADKNLLTLREEIAVAKRYLSIEKHRMGDRLKVVWQIDEQLDLFTKVPALMMQPLVENALYHGIEPLTEGGTVTISLKNLPDAVEVEVANPLSKASGQQKHKGNRMAQDNIRQRLQLAYGDEGKLNIKTTDDLYVVSFRIPRD